MKLAVTVSEAAAMIGISKSMLWRLLAAGDIAKVKIGRRTIIRVVELERFLEGHTEQGDRTTRVADRPDDDEMPGQAGPHHNLPPTFVATKDPLVADRTSQATRGTL